MTHTSKSEEGLIERFRNIEIRSSEEFQRKILEVYSEVCGSFGRDVFISGVIPQLQRLYGNNYKKMGEMALDLIDEAASRKPSKVDGYLSSVLEKELEAKERMLSLSKIEKIICDTILSGEKDFKRFSCHYNIIGVVIYGSYVKGNQRPNSDLDVLYVVRWKDSGSISDLDRLDYVDDFDPVKDFNFSKHFDSKITRQLGLVTELFASVVIDDRNSFLELLSSTSHTEGKYKVISPYKWVHTRITKYTAKGK